ncbi:MAG: antibiotic biosynthesis monooxygenase, partial [Gammaproteobacteria bacterium]|nr:antibiotic biosynthesis monooxygenase [Gammaproteobacteria bacterium]
MTTLLAHITIKPGSEDEFERIMTFMVDSTLSVEDGVVRYEYFKGQKPNFYYCLLSFRDKWAFYDHQNS